MSKKLFGRQLRYKVIGYCLCSLVIAVVLFLALRTKSLQLVEQRVFSDEYQIRLEERVVAEMEEFIQKEDIGIEDSEKLHQWMEEQDGLYIELFIDYRIWMDTYYDTVYDSEENSLTLDIQDRYYTVGIRGAQLQVMVYDAFYSQRYAYLAEIACLLFAFAVFIVVYTNLVQRRFAYIGELEMSMNIMEGGDLERAIPVTGRDELASLAKSMDRMRLAFAKQLREKNQVKEAREELIRAVSHDLRSPLATQIAYLDLMDQEQDRSKISEYVEICRNKAQQMRNLLSQIFHYYKDYEATGEDVVLEEVSGNDLLIQLTEEQACLLREKDFELEIAYIEQPFSMRINPEYMCRIYDNLFSNVDKYASPAEPVRILYRLEEGEVLLEFSNQILEHASMEESNRIGLKNIRRMLELQGGSSEIVTEENHFKACLRLPAITKDEKI